MAEFILIQLGQDYVDGRALNNIDLNIIMSFDFTQNYFELFNIKAVFSVDAHSITERYRQLQRELHPDRYADKSQQEQRMAVQATSHVNMAYETLKSPLKLAIYMLSLQGIDLKSETDTRMNGLFLMKQMEWRESLDEVSDQDDPWEKLDALSDEVSAEKKANLQCLNTQLNQSQWDEARNTVRELQFIEKMQSEIGLKEEALDD